MHSLSASRLNAFLGCSHAAALWLAGVKSKDEVDETLKLIRDKGFEHEAVVLARLEEKYGAAARIPDKGTLAERTEATRRAIEAGATLIYQGALSEGAWLGYPDFLVRAETGDKALLAPEDAKLARRAKGEYLLQLGLYAELMEALYGVPVGQGVVHVAAGAPESFDLRRTRYILKRLMRSFEQFAADDKRQTKALPC